MNARPNTKRAKRPSRPIYAEWRKCVDRMTGEEFLGLRAATGWDQRACKARGYKAGDEVRLEIRKPRNPKFNGLAHALGSILVDNVPGFEGVDAHDALKRIQRECGVQCDEMTIELPGIGKVPVKVARSIGFDSMDEGAWAELWAAMCAYITKTYWPGLDSAAVEEMALMIDGGRA